MRSQVPFVTVSLALVLALWSCSKEKESPPETATSEPSQMVNAGLGYQAMTVENGGTITGKILFKGSWVQPSLAVTKDQAVCGKSKKDPSLIVSQSGDVKNAVVSITDISRGKAMPRGTPVLDQKGCEYHPHVLAFPAGTTLEILNDDGILHNIHSFSEENLPFNKAQPKYLKKITQTFSKPETISVKCDVHGWMSAWLFVAANPYYDVTTESGEFKLTDVPAGDYTLEVWHEKLGKRTKRVTVEPNGTAEVNFEFAALQN